MKKIILLCLILAGLVLLTAQINNPTAAGAAAWGAITGTLSSQTDLQTALNAKAPALLSATVGNTDTLSANSGTQSFATTYTIPANYLVANKVLRVNMGFSLTTSAASSPNINFKLLIGGTTVYTSTPRPGTANTTGVPVSISFMIGGTAAASGSAAVVTMPYTAFGLTSVAFVPFDSGNTNTAQPVNLATNGTLVIQPQYVSSNSTAGNTLTLQQFVVEALN